MTEAVAIEKRVGLAYWMQDVLVQCDKAAGEFASDPVHDLRTALRRCRSMAGGIRAFDPDPAWKKMKRAGKTLFSSLGSLRDAQIMEQWVKHLAPERDTGGERLLDFLANQEPALKKAANMALQQFDRKRWQSWADELPSRVARIPLDSPIFGHLALERWHEGYDLHRRALRNRTKIAFHDLRIGVKHFRYTVENFLPGLYDGWCKDLKELQELLGDVHDLDVLWQTAATTNAFPDSDSRAWWRSRIEQQRQQRLETYRERMVGRNSLWLIWRSQLPGQERLRSLGLERLQTWASFLDASDAHARHVADLALQLYDGLPLEGILRGARRETCRHVLQAASLMHHVGRSRTNAGHHKISARLIRKLGPPLGWTGEEIRMTALVARYHRGALPRETQKRFAALAQSKQRLVQFLAGVLRLACACDSQQDGQIRRIQVEGSGPMLTIRAEGYIRYSSLAEHLAAARHLLELACQRPVLIQPLELSHEAHAA